MGRKLVDFAGAFFMIQFVLLAAFPWIKNFHKFSFIDKEVNDFFINLMDQAIALREKSGVKREDYLAYLIELKRKKSLSDIDLAAHGVTFFTDGFETSSLAIAYMLYEVICETLFQFFTANLTNFHQFFSLQMTKECSRSSVNKSTTN